MFKTFVSLLSGHASYHHLTDYKTDFAQLYAVALHSMNCYRMQTILRRRIPTRNVNIFPHYLIIRTIS